MTERGILPRADRRRRHEARQAQHPRQQRGHQHPQDAPDSLKLEEWNAGDGHEPHQRVHAAAGGLSAPQDGGGGKIINIGSMMSIFGAVLAPPYAREQGRHRAIRRARAQPRGRRTTSRSTRILPGWINTELTAGRARDVHGPARARARRARRPGAGASRRISPASRCSWRAGVGFRHRNGDPGGRRILGAGVALLLMPQSGHQCRKALGPAFAGTSGRRNYRFRFS